MKTFDTNLIVNGQPITYRIGTLEDASLEAVKQVEFVSSKYPNNSFSENDFLLFIKEFIKEKNTMTYIFED